MWLLNILQQHKKEACPFISFVSKRSTDKRFYVCIKFEIWTERNRIQYSSMVYQCFLSFCEFAIKSISLHMFGIYCKFSYDHTLPVLISIIMIGNIVMFPSRNIHSFYYLYYEIIEELLKNSMMYALNKLHFNAFHLQQIL